MQIILGSRNEINPAWLLRGLNKINIYLMSSQRRHSFALLCHTILFTWLRVLQLNWRRSDRPIRLRCRVQLSHFFFLCALRRAASLRDTQTDWRIGGYRGRGMPGRAGYGSEGAVDGGGGGALCP